MVRVGAGAKSQGRGTRAAGMSLRDSNKVKQERWWVKKEDKPSGSAHDAFSVILSFDHIEFRVDEGRDVSNEW